MSWRAAILSEAKGREVEGGGEAISYTVRETASPGSAQALRQAQHRRFGGLSAAEARFAVTHLEGFFGQALKSALRDPGRAPWIAEGANAMSADLQHWLEQSAARHKHLCPRQVLGVRVALAGAAALGLEVPRRDKRLLVILETDGCFADGVEVVTGCTVGHRTLRVEDLGKIAATFLDVKTGRAVRVAPQVDVRQRAMAYPPPGERRRYFIMLHAYQVMPEDELLTVQPVALRQPIEAIISRPGVRVQCARCGEEIINEREVRRYGEVLCKTCAGEGYYLPLAQEVPQRGTVATSRMASAGGEG